MNLRYNQMLTHGNKICAVPCMRSLDVNLLNLYKFKYRKHVIHLTKHND